MGRSRVSHAARRLVTVILMRGESGWSRRPTICRAMSEPRKAFPIFGVIAAVLGAARRFVCGTHGVLESRRRHRTRPDNGFERGQQERAADVGSGDALDGTSAGPGRVLIYNYTLVNVTKGDGLNIKKFEEATRPNIIREYKTNPGLKAHARGRCVHAPSVFG